MNWQKNVKYNKDFLDTIDIRCYISVGKEIETIMDELENKYNETLKDDPILHGNIFNWMDIEDFSRYLENRYNLQIDHWEQQHYKIIKDK